MKLASLKHGRDGRLVVVSRDLAWYAEADAIAPTLQAALDDWARCEPLLRALAESLELGVLPELRFHEHEAASPLPRAYQWADGSAYVNHVALVRQARGAEMPESFWTDPLMYQGGSDGFLGPRDPIPLPAPRLGLRLRGGGRGHHRRCSARRVAGRGAGRRAAGHARQRCLPAQPDPGELAKSFGFFQSKPAGSFSPVAVTPDELGAGWTGGRLHGPMVVDLNDQPFGRADAGVDMTFGFGELIAHAAKTRALVAGSIIGSGTVSNRGEDGGPGKPIADGGAGYSCLAELRTVETLAVRRAVPRRS